MNKKILFTLLPSFVLLFSSARSQSPGQPTEIMILGTMHLHQIKGFEPAMLEKVMDGLDTLDFDVICIESMPAELLYDIESRDDSAFANVLSTFGGRRMRLAQEAREQYGISFQEAQQRGAQILESDSLSPADRISLIRNFIAAADLSSAILQYTYLVESFGDSAGKMLDIPQADMLAQYAGFKNEIYSLAIPLARREGIRQLDYIDNVQDEPLLFKHFPEFIADYLAHEEFFAEITQHPVFLQLKTHEARAVETGDLSALFQFLNSKAYLADDFQAQWEIWLKTGFDSGSDHARFNLWEMRNLQIAANIMKIAAFHPHKRVLVIIGASHKSFLEKYLSQVPSVRLMEYRGEEKDTRFESPQDTPSAPELSAGRE